MTWSDLHTESERLAAEAESSARAGDLSSARAFYLRAADAETRALRDLDLGKPRTRGITAVSAVALWYKARQLSTAESLAHEELATSSLPAFATEQLRALLQAIWSDAARERSNMQFLPGEVIVSVRGGEILPGGAPLDLIVEKVQGVQALFFRTTEFLNGLPHRRHGPPPIEVQESCRPWLFQAPPGSYQFAVAVQEPRQGALFPKLQHRSSEVADTFLRILKAAIEDPEEKLAEIVPDDQYRSTFRKLARNLAPTGKTFAVMEIRSATDTGSLLLQPSVRKSINQAIRNERDAHRTSAALSEEILHGVLRAVHLDQDWLEVAVEAEHVRVHDVGETVDDVIGPMINRPVIVRTIRDTDGRRSLQDIEPDE